MIPRTTSAILLAFCATAIPTPAQVPGKFAQAALLKQNYAAASPNPVYTVMPITVECWAKIPSKDNHNILLANEPKNSVTHWHLYTEKSTGHLATFWPGFKPDQVRSKTGIADNQWHHLAMTNDGQSIALFVDGNQVAREKVEKVFRYPDVGPLTFGHLEGTDAAPAGITLDEVRISRVIRDITTAIPDQPFQPDKDTIALWHFDGDATTKTPWPDASITANPVRPIPRAKSLPAMSGVNVMSDRWAKMNHGPFFSSTLGIPSEKGNVALKGITVRLGDKTHRAAVCFDTELMLVTAAWTDGFVKIHPGREGLSQHPDQEGNLIYSTTPKPGWAKAQTFEDPRPDKLGPLPPDWAKYKGLYLHGDRVIFAYTVGGIEVLETHDLEVKNLETIGNIRLFARTLEIAPSTQPMTARLADAPGAPFVRMALDDSPVFAAGTSQRPLYVARAKGDKEIDIRLSNDGQLHLVVQPHSRPVRCKLMFWSTQTQTTMYHVDAASQTPAPLDLAALTQPGPPRWGQPLITQGTRAKDDAPYVVDTLTAPEDNPYNSFLRFGGHDFFQNGNLAICSVSGDVWIVSNIDDKLERLSWKRFATGLHQPLGLKILNEKIHVLGRDQITRLHDLNHDGEADFYENFNNQTPTTNNGHAYATNLESDPQGNLYFTKCADNTPFGGTLVKISHDGKSAAPIAHGLRNPNGLGVAPAGVSPTDPPLITTADNQGEWIPATRLDLIDHPNEFLGYKPMAKGATPKEMGQPLCFIPQNIDNSAGAQTWVTSEKWGPFKNHLLHTSYGSASLLHILPEKISGTWQAGVSRFPNLKFDSGIMRARFSPKDGQLYLSGLRGWQTVGHKPAALHRVRHTGAPVLMPLALNVHKNGLRLTFPTALDPSTATDPANYSVLRWTYKWTGDYPSRHWSLENPKKQGYDPVEITAARVSPDAKTLFLEIPELAPVLQQQITLNIKSASGAEIRHDIYHTIHALGPQFRE